MERQSGSRSLTEMRGGPPDVAELECGPIG
jgi:hypothetical protein